jgi:putative ABC transport system substrate-binding protein
VTTSAGDPGPKQLEILHEFVPATFNFAALVNPTNSAAAVAMQTEHMQTAARNSGLQIQILRAGADGDFDTVFASLPQLGIGGLVILPDPFYFSRSEQLGALTLRHRIPAIYQYREFTAAGGLASYGNSLTDPYRLLGAYTGRILNGEQPADLPVQQSAKIEFFVNRKTARMIGFDVPPKLLALAYEIME